jgi:hypothetical protein
VFLGTLHERVEELNGAFGEIKAVTVVGAWACECANAACTERVHLSVGRYGPIRAHGSRFLVAPNGDHVRAEAERVVERGDGYWVVETIRRAVTGEREHRVTQASASSSSA